MAHWKHRCPPPLSLFPLCTALLHKLGHRRNPTICHRSLAFGFTFLQRGDPAGLRACAHDRTSVHTDAPGGFSELPDTRSRLLSTISLNGERSGAQPRQQKLHGCPFRWWKLRRQIRSKWTESSCCLLSWWNAGQRRDKQQNSNIHHSVRLEYTEPRKDLLTKRFYFSQQERLNKRKLQRKV